MLIKKMISIFFCVCLLGLSNQSLGSVCKVLALGGTGVVSLGVGVGCSYLENEIRKARIEFEIEKKKEVQVAKEELKAELKSDWRFKTVKFLAPRATKTAVKELEKEIDDAVDAEVQEEMDVARLVEKTCSTVKVVFYSVGTGFCLLAGGKTLLAIRRAWFGKK